MNNPAPTGAYFSLRLSAFFATLGIATGIGMPFFPVWLDYKGLTPQEIGIALAGPMVVRMLFVPLATRLADHFNMLRGAIIVASLGSIVWHVVLSQVDSFVAITAIIALCALFYTPTYPLADAYALRGLAERGKAYGPVRLWSSAAYIVANIFGGTVIGWLTRPSIIWLIIAAYAVGALLAWIMIPLPSHREAAADDLPPARSLWRQPAFVLVLMACAFIQSSHAVYYGFSTLDWSKKGLSDTTIGVLWAIGVIAEMGLFAASSFVNRLISPIALIIAGSFGGIVRWTLMAFDPPLAMLPVLQCLHALTFCATHIGAMQFITHVVPPGRAASAQGDLSGSQSMIFAVAMGGSGVLFNAYGDLAYTAMVLLAFAGAVVAFAAYTIWQDPHNERKRLTP